MSIAGRIFRSVLPLPGGHMRSGFGLDSGISSIVSPNWTESSDLCSTGQMWLFLIFPTGNVISTQECLTESSCSVSLFFDWIIEYVQDVASSIKWNIRPSILDSLSLPWAAKVWITPLWCLLFCDNLFPTILWVIWVLYRASNIWLLNNAFFPKKLW